MILVKQLTLTPIMELKMAEDKNKGNESDLKKGFEDMELEKPPPHREKIPPPPNDENSQQD